MLHVHTHRATARSLAASAALACLLFMAPASAWADDQTDTAGGELAGDPAQELVQAETAAKLEFLYVESSQVCVGQTQNIVAAFLDEHASSETFTLYLRNALTGETRAYSNQDFADNAALFQLTFESNDEVATYEICGVSYGANESETYLDLTESGEAGTFEVLPSTTETISVDGTDVSFYALDAEGQAVELSEVAEAVETADENVAAEVSQAEAAALMEESGTNEAIAESEAVAEATGQDAAVVEEAATTSEEAATTLATTTICLDPGHGGSDGGASANGMKESDLTLSIAKYCRLRLLEYNNVTVVMTRTTDKYVGLEERCVYAQNKNADYFISFHINAAGNSSASGIEVYVPNGSTYRYSYHTIGVKLGKSVAQHLIALGLPVHGGTTAASAVRDNWGEGGNFKDVRYKDGSKADKLSVLYYNRYEGAKNPMPAILIEHLYIDGATDSKKLASATWRKKMGYADADGIAEALGLSAGTWVQLSDGSWKYKIGSSYVKNDWKKIDGKWYRFDENGIMLSSTWFEKDGKKYYLKSSGAAAKGWTTIGTKTYYFNSSCVMLTGWQDILDARYYFKKSTGAMLTGWHTIGTSKYCFNSKGIMQTGWKTASGNRYYLKKSTGAMAKGWVKLGGKWYYLDPTSGVMQTGWKQVKDVWYYLDPTSGVMATGWLNVSNKWYYLDPTSGAMKTGWLNLDGKYYYLKASGAMVSGGWKKIGAKFYYFKTSGVVAKKQYAVPIMGETQTTVADMVAAYKAAGYTYPAKALSKGGARNITEFCKIIYTQSKAEGVRAEVVFAQIMNETGWLQFGGDVSISQYNFAGIGATGNGAAGNGYKDVKTGITAQVQHLKAYASDQPCNLKVVDTRFTYVTRKSAVYVQYLGINENPKHVGWASAKEYGFTLASIMKTHLGIAK